MQADQFPQSPEQITLTNTWMNTKKHGRDDRDIENAKRIAEEQRRKRNKVKPFRQKHGVECETMDSTIQLDGSVEDMLLPVPATTRDSCSSEEIDPDFDGPVISPKTKKKLEILARESREEQMHYEIAPPQDITASPTSPSDYNSPEKLVVAREYSNEKKKRSSNHRRSNKDIVMVQDLNRHILHQSKIIGDLRKKLALIYDISNSNHLGENNIDGRIKTMEEDNVIIHHSSDNKKGTDNGTKEIHLHIH